MQKSIVSQVAKKMVEINSRLGSLADGQYQLSIKSGRKYVSLRQMEYESLDKSPSFSPLKRFADYAGLLSYLIPFNDGLEFAGLEISVPDNSNTPRFIHPDLYSDWKQGEFESIYVSELITDINQTSDSPENFELSIHESGTEIRYQYNYDNQMEADKDLTLFKSAIQ